MQKLFLVNLLIINLVANDILKITYDSVLDFRDRDIGFLNLKTLFNECRASEGVDTNITEAKRRAKEGDLGLYFEAGYRFNSDSTKDNRQSAYVGLAWDILKNGYFGNRKEAEGLKDEINLISLSEDKATEILDCNYNYIIFFFNQLKLKLLHLKRELLNSYTPKLKDLYFLGEIYLDKPLLLDREIKQIDNMIENYKLFDSALFKNLKIDEFNAPPIFDIDIDLLLRGVENNQIQKDKEKLQKKVIENRYSKEDKKLKAYVRSAISEDDRDFVNSYSAGISFSMPLFNSEDEVLKYEKLKIEIESDKEAENRILGIKRYYYEYRYKLDDAIKLYYKRFYVKEKLRRAFYYKSLKIENAEVANIFNRLRDLVDIEFEILDNKKILYSRMLQIFAKAEVDFNEKFLTKVDIEDKFNRLRDGKRAVYIWAKDFNKNPNSDISLFMETKAIRKAIISFGKQIDRDKLLNFYKLADKLGIEVEALVSTNEWIFPNKYLQAITKIEEILKEVDTIHFDIEPHQTLGFLDKKELYLGYYLAFLKEVNKLKGYNKKITIDVPLYFDIEFLKKVEKEVDMMYIMIYGITNFNKFYKKFKKLLILDKTKLTISLRPKDFKNEIELEHFITKLHKELKIDNFAFHDLPQLMDLTK